MKVELWDYLKEQYIGKDPNYKDIGEDIYRVIKEGYCKKLGYMPMKPMAVITVTDGESPILQDISCSEPNDILLNNFGFFLSGVLGSGIPAAGAKIQMVDNFGFTRNYNMRSAGDTYNRTSAVAPILSTGMGLQIGQNPSGLTPTRSDFQLFVPFAATPEALPFSTGGAGVWVPASQQAVCAGIMGPASIVGGTVRESLLLAFWQDESNIQREVALSHDQVFVSFGAGGFVTLTYTWGIV